jgi:endonuclease/exonuclease/phosphatase family metal-dependent hydrolase
MKNKYLLLLAILSLFSLNINLHASMYDEYYDYLWKNDSIYEQYYDYLWSEPEESTIPESEPELEVQESTSSEDASSLKLASWNIRIFSKSRTDAQLKKICNIMKQFDFITIIELRDSVILDRAVAMLKSLYNKNYAYEFSPAVGAGVKEYYAFFYDTSKVRVLKRGQIYNDSTFLRCPYYATFKANNFDFTAIAIHIIWGDSVGERRKEIKRMATVYQDIQNSDPHENDILLMGDFNRDPDDDLAWGALRSISSLKTLFSLPASSMIWDSHLYDNMMFQTIYTTEYSLDHGIIRFDETDFGNDDNAANKDVSDHRPIWAIFRTDIDDD